MAPGQEANGETQENLLDLLHNGILSVLIRITSMRRF